MLVSKKIKLTLIYITEWTLNMIIICEVIFVHDLGYMGF